MHVEVNNTVFIVEQILKKNNKRIYIRTKDNKVCITTPTVLDSNFVYSIIKKNFNAIIKAMQNDQKKEDEIHYLGKKYNLVLIKGFNDFVYLNDNTFVVEYTKEELIKKNIVTFYNETLKRIIDNHKNEIFSKFNLKDVCFKYKYVSSYFGECFYKKNLIILSSKLAKYEINYIFSVIYHECAHFKYHNHQEEFYDYLESIFPNYRKTQSQMRKIKYKDFV